MSVSVLALCVFCLIVVWLFAKARFAMASLLMLGGLAAVWLLFPPQGAKTFVTVSNPNTSFWPTGRISLRNNGKNLPRFEVPIDARDFSAWSSRVAPDDFPRLFAVYVDQVSSQAPSDQPAMLGTYGYQEGKLFFEPRYPLSPGVTYRAVFDTGRLPGIFADQTKLTAQFVVPRPEPSATAVVQQVYPTRSRLPENQLKFYLHFSAPMSRGEAYKRVHLIDDTGKEIELPFLELHEELWDPSGQRFTLLFDPGRIKRNLKPREELGPSLIEGRRYTFVVDREWSDAHGNPLKDSFRKAFEVGPLDDVQPDPARWKLVAPSAGGTAPLQVAFPEPLDHGLLQRLLWVVDSAGNRVPGKVNVTDDETRWQFMPEKPWSPGRHRLIIDTALEDLAGNSVAKPFEIDVFKTVQREIKAEMVELPFDIK